tara:strand:+ start:734 stop:1711 length:978 start_codon:yes stop_codon:yes gene_type:complete
MKISKKKTLIIAEIGNNHEGDFGMAKKLISLAAKAKVDAVKFQIFKTENFVSINEKKRFKKLKSFELSYSQFKKLKDLAKKKKLLFIATPLDLESADFVIKYCDIIKIASGDNDFFELIKKVTKGKKKLIISTGASNHAIISNLLNFLEKYKARKKTSLLHCVSSYPVTDSYANLHSIKYLKDKTKLKIGYSDHTIGYEACLAAVAIGAEIIEKHFTIDKNYSSFRDHKLSADLKEMKKIVQGIRRIENMKGDYSKFINRDENKNFNLLRRSLYAKKNIKIGDKFSLCNTNFLRPRKKTSEINNKNFFSNLSKTNIAKDKIIKNN